METTMGFFNETFKSAKKFKNFQIQTVDNTIKNGKILIQQQYKPTNFLAAPVLQKIGRSRLNLALNLKNKFQQDNSA